LAIFAGIAPNIVASNVAQTADIFRKIAKIRNGPFWPFPLALASLHNEHTDDEVNQAEDVPIIESSPHKIPCSLYVA